MKVRLEPSPGESKTGTKSRLRCEQDWNQDKAQVRARLKSRKGPGESKTGTKSRLRCEQDWNQDKAQVRARLKLRQEQDWNQESWLKYHVNTILAMPHCRGQTFTQSTFQKRSNYSLGLHRWNNHAYCSLGLGVSTVQTKRDQDRDVSTCRDVLFQNVETLPIVETDFKRMSRLRLSIETPDWDSRLRLSIETFDRDKIKTNRDL